jgi:hypothetical protein
MTVYVTVDFIGLIYFYWIMEYTNLRKILIDTKLIIFSSHCFQGHNDISSMKNNDRTYLFMFSLSNGVDFCTVVQRPALRHNKPEKMWKESVVVDLKVLA